MGVPPACSGLKFCKSAEQHAEQLMGEQMQIRGNSASSVFWPSLENLAIISWNVCGVSMSSLEHVEDSIESVGQMTSWDILLLQEFTDQVQDSCMLTSVQGHQVIWSTEVAPHGCRSVALIFHAKLLINLGANIDV